MYIHIYIYIYTDREREREREREGSTLPLAPLALEAWQAEASRCFSSSPRPLECLVSIPLPRLDDSSPAFIACGFQVVHRVSSSFLGPVDPLFRAISGRLKLKVRRHKSNKHSLLHGLGLGSGVRGLQRPLGCLRLIPLLRLDPSAPAFGAFASWFRVGV
jgi:hypothetical protein